MIVTHIYFIEKLSVFIYIFIINAFTGQSIDIPPFICYAYLVIFVYRVYLCIFLILPVAGAIIVISLQKYGVSLKK